MELYIFHKEFWALQVLQKWFGTGLGLLKQYEDAPGIFKGVTGHVPSGEAGTGLSEETRKIMIGKCLHLSPKAKKWSCNSKSAT